ncbi:hypothetical protein ACO22_04028 [Paracoccidioides brasiliensis]|uniref:Uncharacterized protein n=1 Tax=Paracoccidioides brasiliensis TaxID=121759 RepID=A0A1D2JEH7_PARBR|nr:hypothetical protein ACO22_04028 [Paracoccidioides brasiliensis]
MSHRHPNPHRTKAKQQPTGTFPQASDASPKPLRSLQRHVVFEPGNCDIARCDGAAEQEGRGGGGLHPVSDDSSPTTAVERL